MIDINFFLMGVILLIISRTGYGYTNNDFCMGESTSYQDVCESRAGHFYEIETKFRHSKYSPMPKQQGATSRYYSGTENSRIYKERNRSKEEHSNYVYKNQHTSKDRQQKGGSNYRRINELHNRSFGETKTRDLSRQRVDISSHRNTYERGESASRPRYSRDVLTVSTRMYRDIPFNGFRKERESHYNFRLHESQNAVNRVRRQLSDRHSTVQQRDVRSSRQDRMDDGGSTTKRDEVRLSGNRRSKKNRSSMDVDRDQTRARNIRRIEYFNHSFQSRGPTSAHSRRMETQERHRISKHVESRLRTPVGNNRRIETREHELKHRDRIPADENRHVETRDRYVENSDGTSTDRRRSMETLYYRVMSNADDQTLHDNRINLLENRDSRIESRNRITLDDQQHAQSRNHVVTRSIESNDRNVERLERISVDNARRMEVHLNRFGSRDRMSGESIRRVVTRNRNPDNRNWVSGDDSGLKTARESRIKSDDRTLILNDIRRQKNPSETVRVKIYDRMHKNYERTVTRSLPLNAMNREPSIERHNRMPGRRDHNVKNYNRMPENNGAFHVEKRSIYIKNNNRTLDVSSNRAESRRSILADDGLLNRERRSFDIERNVANNDNTLNNIERRSDRRMPFDNDHAMETRRSVNAIRTARVRENLERHSHNTFRAHVLQNVDWQGFILKDTNLLVKYSVSDSYRRQSRRGSDDGASHERRTTWMNRKQAIDTKVVDDAPAHNILLNTFKTLLIGLLIIQLVDFRRHGKLRESSSLAGFTLNNLRTN